MNFFFKGKIADVALGSALSVTDEHGRTFAGTIKQINADAVLVASVRGEDGKPSLPGDHPVFAFPVAKLPAAAVLQAEPK